MVLPVVVLAALAAVGGVLKLPFGNLDFLSEWLEPTFAGTHPAHPTSFVAGFSLSVLAVVIGLRRDHRRVSHLSPRSRGPGGRSR